MNSPSRTAERLQLTGKLSALPWITVSRGDKAGAPGEKVVLNVRTAEDIAQAFGRRERDVPSPK